MKETEKYRRMVPATLDLYEGEAVFRLLGEGSFLEAWDKLYQDCPWATMFQGPEFVKLWCETYQLEYTPIFIVEKYGTEITGLLTLAKDSDGNIMAAGDSQAEYQCWLTDPSDKGVFIQKAIALARKNYPGARISLKYIPGNVPMEWLHGGNEYKHTSLLQSYPHNVLHINEELLNNDRRKKNRKEKFNRLKRFGNLEFERVKDTSSFAAIYDEISVQSDFRKGAMYDRIILNADPHRKDFLFALFERGMIHATVLKLNGRVIASNIGATGRKWLHMQGINSHDPYYSKYSPGILHFLLMDTMMHEEGIEIFDLTPGVESYKARLGSETRVAYSLVIDSAFNTTKNRLRNKVAAYFKQKTQKAGITPDALKKIKFRFRKYLRMATTGAGVKTLVKEIAGSSGRASETAVFNLVQRPVQPSLINVERNSLRDLLKYKTGKGFPQLRWDFLSDSMERLEDEQVCFTHTENGNLSFCAWFKTRKNEDGSSMLYLEEVNYTDDVKIMLNALFLSITQQLSTPDKPLTLTLSKPNKAVKEALVSSGFGLQ